jgi:hypothetical protein
MNWCLIGCTAACIPVVLCFREHYSRYDIDVMETLVPPGDISPIQGNINTDANSGDNITNGNAVLYKDDTDPIV